MKKLRVRVLAFLLCIFIFIPQQLFVVADGAIGGGIDISGNDVSGGDISGSDVSGGDVSGGDVSGGDISGGDISEGDLPGGVPTPYAEPGDSAPATGAHGSGSYQLNANPDHYRFYTEYFVKADTNKSIKSAGIDRRTSIKVYAKEGEIILFGSSVAKSQIDENNNYVKTETKSDIVITTPSGAKISNDVLVDGEFDVSGNKREHGLGYIKTPTQEKNGPMVNYTNEADWVDYYVPLQYHVEQEGVYTFEFHSVTGFNPNNATSTVPNNDHPVPALANDDHWNQGKTSVAAWDVTVLGKKNASEWEVKSGRAWADYLALTTGGQFDAKNGNKVIKSDLSVHVLSHDGYQYKVDFDEAAPYGFIFFANNTGFMSKVTDEDGNVTYRPIYHSFYDATNDLDGMESKENIYLHWPDEQDTDTEETYKIFFNAPNPDLNGLTYKKYAKDYTTGEIIVRDDTIKTQPDEIVEIPDLTFSGLSDAVSTNNVTRTGHGGYFTFNSSGEAMVTIRLDLRKAIFDSEQNGTIDTYNGSGIVEITTPAVKTYDISTNDQVHEINRVYWDGKDTDGVVIPAGVYGNQNVVISSEAKRGELHFPVIDMEGLYGGLTVQRLNGENPDASTNPHVYDLYYNNNPLVYGSIEKQENNKSVNGYFDLSDGTRSYSPTNADKISEYFFKADQSTISTLKRDDKEYLAQKLFGTSYADLEASNSTAAAIIDAEFETEKETYHYEAVNSKAVLMRFNADSTKYLGGGNMAGIDAWTYYSAGVVPKIISFAVMDSVNRGIVKGQIFYDAHDVSGQPNSRFDEVTDKDYLLSGIKVRLIDGNGNPLVHQEKLPVFDESGHFKYDKDGKIVFSDTDVKYESVTDSTGTYRFTGVPYSSDANTTYYVQVMLTDIQSEVMRYTCTTSKYIKDTLRVDASDPATSFIPAVATITGDYGADGNKISPTDDPTKVYKYKYDRDGNHETVFVKDQRTNPDYAQSVTFLPADADYITATNPVVVKEFKKIGFSSTVPNEHQKNYKVIKDWGTDSRGQATHQISDGLIVELWVWNDKYVDEVNAEENKLSRRTGALVDTQVLHYDSDPTKSWTYTWEKLDDRLQYYVLEYYNKKKDNGEVIYNDKGEPRRVLVGGTMPIFDSSSSVPENGIYGFKVKAGDYSETKIVDGEHRIPVQYFNDGKSHSNALTDQEKLESVENNARQYDVAYTLTKNGDKTNVITLKNSQVYDDRAYYVWLGHESKLPEMIALTFVDHDVSGNMKNNHPVTLQRDKLLDDGTFTIKGLSISSVDAAADNKESNATDSFRIKDEAHDYAFFIPTDKNYKTGTGTRTYRVKYVVRASDKSPVSITTVSTNDVSGTIKVDLVETGTTTKVEEDPAYIVYSWYMTIHVYDLVPDGVIEYDPNGGPIVLQEALEPGSELEYKLEITDPNNFNAISYYSTNDARTGGIFENDTFRVPLYKHAVHPDMGTCADIVGVYWAGSTPADDSTVSTWNFEDTYNSKYGQQSDYDLDNSGATKEDGVAVAGGNGGDVTVELSTQRISKINRTQDHANYAQVTFTPDPTSMARAIGTGEDVFYYKVVVFAEDNMYLYTDYNDINALEGVVMYSYFTMKPKNTSTGGGDDEGNTTPKDAPIDTAAIVLGSTAPKTGDENNLILWLSLMILSLAVIAFSLSKKDKN